MSAPGPADRRVLPCGERAVIIECADTGEALGLSLALEQAQLDGIDDVVPGAETVLVRFTRPPTDHELASIARRPVSLIHDHPGAALEVEVSYDGADLAAVAGLLTISEAEVITRHTGQTWTVAFCGFAPGFGYLRGEHDDLRVPRRSSPRVRVPTGAVGLADRWSGVYPREGPGGWQLIGHTRLSLWDLDRDPPALLRPGTTVRFIAS